MGSSAELSHVWQSSHLGWPGNNELKEQFQGYVLLFPFCREMNEWKIWHYCDLSQHCLTSNFRMDSVPQSWRQEPIRGVGTGCADFRNGRISSWIYLECYPLHTQFFITSTAPASWYCRNTVRRNSKYHVLLIMNAQKVKKSSKIMIDTLTWL